MILAALVLTARSARSADAPCFAAFAEGQKLEKAGTLRAARARYDACLADTTCPAPPLIKDCVDQRRAVDARIGSIVLEASDARGAAIVSAHVRIDGLPALERLDGKAIDLDPGAHRIELESEGKAPAAVSVLVGEGQKLRRVAVTFRDLPTKADAERTPPRPPPSRLPVYVLGALGVVGVGVGGALALHGQIRLDQCPSSGCPASTIDALRSERIVAWSSLGVGVAALAAAGIYFLLTTPRHSPQVE